MSCDDLRELCREARKDEDNRLLHIGGLETKR